MWRSEHVLFIWFQFQEPSDRSGNIHLYFQVEAGSRGVRILALATLTHPLPIPLRSQLFPWSHCSMSVVIFHAFLYYLLTFYVELRAICSHLFSSLQILPSAPPAPPYNSSSRPTVYFSLFCSVIISYLPLLTLAFLSFGKPIEWFQTYPIPMLLLFLVLWLSALLLSLP